MGSTQSFRAKDQHEKVLTIYCRVVARAGQVFSEELETPSDPEFWIEGPHRLLRDLGEGKYEMIDGSLQLTRIGR